MNGGPKTRARSGLRGLDLGASGANDVALE